MRRAVGMDGAASPKYARSNGREAQLSNEVGGMAEDTRRRRPGGRTGRHTEAIFRSTLELLAVKGYAALVLNDIAEAAGVHRTTLYRRWTSRAELVLDAVEASVTERIVPPDLGSLRADMRATLRQIADYLATPLGAAALAASVEIGTRETPTGAPDRWLRRMAELDPMFARAQARGEITADYDREGAVALAAGALYVSIVWIGGPISDGWIDRALDAWRPGSN